MTLVDPFAQAPADEAQAEPAEAAKSHGDPLLTAVKDTVTGEKPAPKKGISVAVTPVIQGAELGHKWVATFKGGSAYDAPWLVGHMSSLEEVNDHLTGDKAVLLADTFDKLQRAAGKFVSLAPVKVPVAAGGGSAPAVANPSAPPRGAVSAPGGESRQCKHGEMTFKTGFSAKTNKTWSAFMCPSPKGTPDQCDAEWLR